MKVTLRYAERQLRYWINKVQELRLTSNASNAKEDEEGKEKIPPTPPKREKGEEEENSRERETRARVGVIPTEADVNAYVRETHPGKTIDVAACLAYNKVRIWSKPEGSTVDWHNVIDLWISIKGFIEPSPAQKSAPAKPYYSLSEWVLCAERCANFRDGKCTCGENVPPACRAYPIPPEECRNFTKTEGGEQ